MAGVPLTLRWVVVPTRNPVKRTAAKSLHGGRTQTPRVLSVKPVMLGAQRVVGVWQHLSLWRLVTVVMRR